MDISHLQRFRDEADAARQDADRDRTIRRDAVWSGSAASIYASISEVAGHLAVVAAGFPHAEGLVRQQVARLTEAVTGLYVLLTEPPECGAESIIGVDADGVLLVEECARRYGHEGTHSAYQTDRSLVNATAQLLVDVNKLSDGVRRAILLSPGRPDGNLPGPTARRVLTDIVGRAVNNLRRIAAALEHHSPHPAGAVSQPRASRHARRLDPER